MNNVASISISQESFWIGNCSWLIKFYTTFQVCDRRKLLTFYWYKLPIHIKDPGHNADHPVSRNDLYKAYGHVHTIVFFIGYPRSRHSLLGSLMDAHPRMVVSDERMAFNAWRRRSCSFIDSSIYKFYDIMFQASEKSVSTGRRSRTFEGNVTNKASRYGYMVPNQWQGRFDQYIEVSRGT